MKAGSKRLSTIAHVGKRHLGYNCWIILAFSIAFIAPTVVDGHYHKAA